MEITPIREVHVNDILSLPHGSKVNDMFNSWPMYISKSDVVVNLVERMEKALFIFIKTDNEEGVKELLPIIAHCWVFVDMEGDSEPFTSEMLLEFYTEFAKRFA